VRFSALETQIRRLISFKIDELLRELRNLKLQYSSSIFKFNIQLQYSISIFSFKFINLMFVNPCIVTQL